ncbi:MAG: SUMF1/EgtB/PvdO family nonheme iron enzyme, partial [Acidobacteria bacterium]|nr:SUMF1/EgtB/PvdO family nonheme iron enzyme [Acidobacteriota bacterium]
MKLIAAVPLVAILSAATPLAATGLSVSTSALERDAASVSTTVSVSWRNAWRNERNHDAVWLFVRVAGKDGRSRPVRVARSGHTATGSLEIRTPEDRAGVFVFPSAAHRGDVTTKVRLELDANSLPSDPVTAAVFGLEMVSIPAGPFFLGDVDPVALDYGGFFRAGQNGEPDGLFEVKSEAPIPVGPFAGGLDYRVKWAEYEGDRRGPVPAAFPKGTSPFYVMKYEITQGQYAAFLNTLGDEASHFRAIHGGRDYAKHRGSISLQSDGRYVAASPARPANRVSWDDGCAFADWAGLRPMTDLEYVKAARGPEKPLARAFPWGTASRARVLRVVRPDDELVTTGDANEKLLN